MAGYLIEMFAVSLTLTVLAESVAVCFLLRLAVTHGEPQDRKDGRGEPIGNVLHTDTGENSGCQEDLACVTGGFGAVARAAGPKWILLVLLINVLTNPPAVLLCWLGRMYLPGVLHFPVQIALEAVVVAVEAGVYCSFAGKPRRRFMHPFQLSIAANGCSWLMGMLFMALRN